MSNTWSYTATLTVWLVTGYDDNSQPTFATPSQIKGSWAQGGETQIDDNGREFVPRSTYWLESVTPPTRGSYILPGAHTNTDPIQAGAEMIKKVSGWDDTTFDMCLPDWALYT
jgi:hypothetical protein